MSPSVSGAVKDPVLSVDLPIEPAHDTRALSLADAAALNDFPQFDQLYRAAAARGQAPAAWVELHSFWTWSLNHSTGAFYGRSMHEQLAALYPAYASYIADFALVDAHGETFYPSAETRRFLVAQATSGAEPRITTTQIATAAMKPVSRNSKASLRATRATHPTHRAHAAIVVPPATAIVAAAEPLPIARVIPIPVRLPVEAPAPGDHRLGQALLLTILGLLGLGVVSLILHTPREERPTSRHSQA